jgi:hypothetical protein
MEKNVLNLNVKSAMLSPQLDSDTAQLLNISVLIALMLSIFGKNAKMSLSISVTMITVLSILRTKTNLTSLNDSSKP